MENPLISIIIPVYNAERYLASCLDSILEQSYRNLEVIIINDGSLDFSLNIAEKYAEQDDRLKVYSQDNSGPSEARNYGLSVSTGNYISFVDADDMVLPKAFEMMLKIMDTFSADIVEGRVTEGKIYKKIEYINKLHSEFMDSKSAIERVLYQKDMLSSPWGKLYKKSLFDDVKFEKGLIYEDLDIFYKVYERADKITYTNFPVYFYRNNEESTLHTWKPQRLDVLKVTENIEKYIAEKYPELLPAAQDRRLSANFNMFALCSINGDNDTAAKCWEKVKLYRKQSLINPKVRLKNKFGILSSYLGKNFFKQLSKLIYR